MKKTIILIFISIILFACPAPEDDYFSICDQTTIINNEEFNNVVINNVYINSFEIIENCLTINFSASGCDGESWVTELYDANEIIETEPQQRNLRLSLINNETCLTIITKEITFDISNLQINNNSIYLNLTNSGDQILYKY